MMCAVAVYSRRYAGACLGRRGALDRASGGRAIRHARGRCLASFGHVRDDLVAAKTCAAQRPLGLARVRKGRLKPIAATPFSVISSAAPSSRPGCPRRMRRCATVTATSSTAVLIRTLPVRWPRACQNAHPATSSSSALSDPVNGGRRTAPRRCRHCALCAPTADGRGIGAAISSKPHDSSQNHIGLDRTRSGGLVIVEDVKAGQSRTISAHLPSKRGCQPGSAFFSLQPPPSARLVGASRTGS
jgi:hypothetical protein